MGMASSSSIFHKTESCEKKWGKLTSIFTKFGQEFLHLLKLLYPPKQYNLCQSGGARHWSALFLVYDPTSTSSRTKEGRKERRKILKFLFYFAEDI